MKMLKKRLAGGLKLVFVILFFFSKNSLAQILDYETEIFISELISEIKEVNQINKNINFKIISDNKINAFVDENNTIYITSGLIENCDDYVAFMSVLAHEVGHIDQNHLIIRKSSAENISNLKKISDFTIIAGSVISGTPELLQGIGVGQASISNVYINFSKDQEREADYYSVQTLEKLNVNSESIINLLKTLEKNALQRGLTKEKQKLSSHPYFEERIDIINYVNKNRNNKFNIKTNNEFYFIKAKFLGYNENAEIIEKINNPFKLYAESIMYAKKGRLLESLSILNDLIAKNKENIHLIETKADILYSYGYTKEAIKFYELVLKNLNDNIYAQMRIFQNINLGQLSIKEAENIFEKNINLINNHYNNREILLTYLELSKITNQKHWIDFINLLFKSEGENINDLKKKLSNYKKTKDKNLLNLIKIIQRDL